MTDALDAPALLGQDGLGDAVAAVRGVVRPVREVFGWGTVEIERAVADLAAGDGPPPGAASAARPGVDDLLGARTLLMERPERDPLEAVLLLEPSIDGLLAGSLARFGEGRLALYLVAPPGAAAAVEAAGFALSREGVGPLGRQRRVLVGPRWGPHLLVVAGSDGPATTIGS